MMSDDPRMTEDENRIALSNFERVRSEYLAAYAQIKLFLLNLSGSDSRALGSIVQIIVDADSNKETTGHDWPTVMAAKFLRGDSELWHLLANSRKR